MAKGNRESKKPKKEKIKTIAAAPSQKGATAGWQPTFGSGKKKLKKIKAAEGLGDSFETKEAAN